MNVALTGASGFVGQHLLPQLDAVADRVVAFDVRDPARRSHHLEFHRLDVAGTELKPLLEGVDVLVHLAAVGDPIPDERLMAHVNVEGTRHLLDAASAVGIRKVVRVSSAAVYGAWPNNPVPLTEDAVVRPNEGFAPAVQAAEAERLLVEWAGARPGAVATVLRTAPVLGPGAEHLAVRMLAGRPPLRIRGAAPPLQFVHVDDVVAALVLAVREDLPGAYNLAADGWLGAEEVRALVPRHLALPLPPELAERLLRALWASGLGDVPPTVLPYLIHPWVVANDRLRSAGWAPVHTNEEAIVAGLSSMPTSPSAARALLAAGGAALVGAAVLGWRRHRRHRRG